MKYTLILKNNETGEEIIKQECNAFIGGCSGDDNLQAIVKTSCTTLEMLGCIDAAETSIQQVLKDNPEAKAIREFVKILSKKVEKEGAKDE